MAFVNGHAIYTLKCKRYLPDDCGTNKLEVNLGDSSYRPVQSGMQILIRRLAGAIACRDCVAGTYLATEGNDAVTDCVLCGLGKYSSAMGASACLDCTSGKFSGVPGALVCTNCAAGKFSNAVGASVASTCASCAAGMHSASGASACIFCAAGMYAFEASQCIACPAGKYGETGCRASSNSFVRLVACTSEACRLEVWHEDQWGTVCDDEFNHHPVNAAVVCRSLGLPTGTNFQKELSISTLYILRH
jgi:hypothetical protein